MTSRLNPLLIKIKNKIKSDGDLKSIAKGGSISFIVNLVGIFIGYLFVILVSRIYKNATAEIYGQYILVTLLIRIGSIITRFGTDTTMLQITASLSADKLWDNIVETNRKLLFILLAFGLTVTILFALLSNQLAYLLKLPANMVLIACPFIIPMALGLYYSQSLRGLKQIGISTFLRSSSLQILNFLLLPVFLIFVGRSSDNFNQLPVFTYCISIVITGIGGFYYWSRSVAKAKQQQHFYKEEYKKTYRQLLRMSYPFLLTESTVFIGTWVDQLILGMLGTHSDVGIFNLCVKYSLITTLSFQAINTMSAPKFAECFHNKDFSGLAKYYQKATRIIFWTSIPIFTIYFLFPKFLLGISGPSFIRGWLTFIIINIGGLINVLTGSNSALLQMTGHQKLLQNILLITVALEIGLNYILIPIFGVTGAAIASTVCCCFNNGLMIYFIKKYFGFNSFVKLF